MALNPPPKPLSLWTLSLSPSRTTFNAAVFHYNQQLPCLLFSRSAPTLSFSSASLSFLPSRSLRWSRRPPAVAATSTLMENSVPVGLVSDYDLLALDSISGTGRSDTNMFPEVDITWKTFNEIQKLLSKTNGKLVGDLLTPAPVVVLESTNLEDAARLLLETKYRRLPVVDGMGRLVGIIARGNVVRAALQIKRAREMRP